MLKLTTKPFAGRTLRDLLIHIKKFGHAQKAKFRESWLLLSLCLLASVFAFLASFFFSFAEHLVGFILVGNVFRKAFRILGLRERKGRLVVDRSGTRFTWQFSGQCYVVFSLFLRCP